MSNTCEIKSCNCTQEVEQCPICLKYVCWHHRDDVYDTNTEDTETVCTDCIKKNRDRFLKNAPKVLTNKHVIIKKLRNKEMLSDIEMNNLADFLDD